MPGPDGPSPRHAIVVGDGDVPPRAALDDAWPGWSDDASVVVAADGGLVRARDAGLVPTVLVGDLDSLDPARVAAAEADGLPIVRAATDKDESDMELAVLEAVRQGARRLTIVGAFGGPRLDHALANVGLLALPALRGVDVAMLDARVRVRLLVADDAAGGSDARARLSLPGPMGATVSLLPMGGAAIGVTTSGLRYPLRDEDLHPGPARGLSNVRTERDAAVTLRSGSLLVLEGAAPQG